MFVALVCLGKKTYTLSKTDLIDQFTGRIATTIETDLLGQLTTQTGNFSIGSIYCFDEDGNKVWLSYNKNTQLKIKLGNNSSKILLLSTVTIGNDTI